MESSIDSPATPVATQRVTLSATSSGFFPYPDMKSALTGRSTAAVMSCDIGQVPVAGNDGVVSRIRKPL